MHFLAFNRIFEQSWLANNQQFVWLITFTWDIVVYLARCLRHTVNFITSLPPKGIPVRLRMSSHSAIATTSALGRKRNSYLRPIQMSPGTSKLARLAKRILTSVCSGNFSLIILQKLSDAIKS